MSELILAYEKKMSNGEFLPNGMTDEIYHIWKSSPPDEIQTYQFHQEYMIDILKYQGFDVKLMTISKAISTGKKFIYLFECHSYILNWFGFHSVDGREIFSFFSKETLKSIRNGQCKVVFHAGTEGTDGLRVNEFVALMSLYCYKYKIDPKSISYISSNMKFIKQFNDVKLNFKYNGYIKIYESPYFWEASKFIYHFHKKEINRLVYPQALKTPKNKKNLRYLCFNKVPRGHRYLIAMHLWNKHVDHGLLSMSGWDHEELVYWKHWKRCTNENETELFSEIEKEFRKKLPLSIDVSYEIGESKSHTTWLMNSWPFLQTNFSIVTETSCGEWEIFITEKTFKAIANMHPFLVVGNKGIIDTLQKLGFKTFHPIIDEGYDQIDNEKERLKFIMNEIDRLCSMEWKEFYDNMRKLDDTVLYNYKHFWESGNFTSQIFERILNA